MRAAAAAVVVILVRRYVRAPCVRFRRQGASNFALTGQSVSHSLLFPLWPAVEEERERDCYGTTDTPYSSWLVLKKTRPDYFFDEKIYVTVIYHVSIRWIKSDNGECERKQKKLNIL